MGCSSKSTINDIIKLIECDHGPAFIGLGAAAGCHGNCVFHSAPRLCSVQADGTVQRGGKRWRTPQIPLPCGDLMCFSPQRASHGDLITLPCRARTPPAPLSICPAAALLRLSWARTGIGEEGKQREEAGLFSRAAKPTSELNRAVCALALSPEQAPSVLSAGSRACRTAKPRHNAPLCQTERGAPRNQAQCRIASL